MTPPRRASQTALLVSAYRARAHEAFPALCRDAWAAGLAGPDGIAFSHEFDAFQPAMVEWLAVRTAWFDAFASAAMDRGVRQVVVLGAGYDTRAARLARDGVRFFEVDQPASSREKHARLETLEGYPLDAATYVECDFEHEDFLDRLGGAGLGVAAPTVVLWEGVTHYLAEAAIRSTLRRVATGLPPETRIAFDFVGKKMAAGTARDPNAHATRDLVRDRGEPIKWGTNDVLPLLVEEGYRDVRVRSFDELGLERLGTYDRARMWRFQWIAEASVAPPAFDAGR